MPYLASPGLSIMPFEISKKATGVITAADGFWNAANRLFEEVDVRNIVEIDNGTQL